MTTRADFTDEEWARLGRAPLIAGMAITLADPGGPLEAVKESGAALETVRTATRTDDFGPFVQAVAKDFAARAERRDNPLAGFRPDREHALDEVLDELRAVNRLLESKVAAEDAADFRDWIRSAAQGAALAAKEGGFLGFGGVRVSEREQEMLERLGRIFEPEPDRPMTSPPPPGPETMTTSTSRIDLTTCRIGPAAAVSDMARARAFYEGPLGLVPGRQEGEHAITYPCGGDSEMLVYVSDFAGTSQATVAGFEVPDVVAAVRDLAARGVTFERYDEGPAADELGVVDMGHFKAAWFRDPDGNTFSL